VAAAIHTPWASSSTPGFSRSIRHRSTAALRRAPVRQLGTESAARALRRQHEHRSTRLHRLGTEVVEAFEEVFTSAPGRLIVRLSPRAYTGCRSSWISRRQFDRKVAFLGRGMIENSQTAQRTRLPAHPAVFRSATPSARLSRAGRPLPDDGAQGENRCRALAHGHRRSSSREASVRTIRLSSAGAIPETRRRSDGSSITSPAGLRCHS